MNIVRIVDMSGCISFLTLMPLFAILISKKSKLLHKLHSPLTILCTVMLLLHLVTSFMIGSVSDMNFVIVIGSGILAVIGFVVSILTVIQKKKRTKARLKWHIIFAIATFIITVIHIKLAGMLL